MCLSLACLTLCSIKLKMLKCGGMLSKAHSVCVPNKVTRLRKFPLLPEETGVIYYSKAGKDGAPKKHQVRPRVVYELWRVLKENSPPYKQQSIDWVEERAQQNFGVHAETTPTDLSVEMAMPSIHVGDEPNEDIGPAAGQHPGAIDDAHETVSGFSSPLPAPDIQASLEQACANLRARAAAAGPTATSAEASTQDDSNAGGSHNRQTSQRASTAPVFHVSGGDHAVSEFDPYFFTAAFPEIFFDGAADLIVHGRSLALDNDIGAWLEHLVWTGDQRAARHTVFCFVAFSVMQRHKAMSQGSFFVHARMGTKAKDNGKGDGTETNRHREEPLSLDDLNERVANGDDSLAHAVYFWGGNLRGSHAYNAMMKREIDAMISAELSKDEPRPPSLFLSLSCAEFYWNAMLAYLRTHITAVEGADPGDLLHEENANARFLKLQEYAAVVTLFFEQRAKEYIDTVLAPMLGIDLFYAVCEFADGRGQIHIHFLGWIKGGEPHRLMHELPTDLVDRIRLGGRQAEEAWEEAIVRRKTYAHYPAPLASMSGAIPESVYGGGPSDKAKDARLWAFKGFVLERWMRERNFSAAHPAGSHASVWPPPEGSAPRGDATVCSAFTLDALDIDPPMQHRNRIVSAVKRHSCVPGYCLRPLVGHDPNHRVCAKGNFGLEAPLLGHMLEGPMHPKRPEAEQGMPNQYAERGQEATRPHRGRAIRFDAKGQYYVVRVDDEREVALESKSGSLYICRLADPRESGDTHAFVRPAALDGEPREQCKAPDCKGCNGAPPMGKRKLSEPTLTIEDGLVKIHLPRSHPRVVQGIQVCARIAALEYPLHTFSCASALSTMCLRAPCHSTGVYGVVACQ